MTARSLLLLACLLAASCGDGTTPIPTGPTPPPNLGALTITCPTGVVAATTGTSTAVTYPAPTTSGGQAPVTVTCSPFSGSIFPLGSTTVACQATDARNTAAACTFLALVSRIPTVTRTTFLAFGDSVTSGEVTVPAPGTTSGAMVSGPRVVVPGASYPTQLLTLLHARYTAQAGTITVTNSGRSGEAASEGALRLPGVLSAVRPNVVFLLEGFNDLALFDTAGISRGIAAMDTMAREARTRGARVFLLSLTPSRPGGRNSLLPSVLVEYNNRLRTLAAGEGAVYVDLYNALLPSLTTSIGTDGLHPTEAGYRRIAEEVFLAVRANLEAP